MISVIIPFLNEEKNLVFVHQELMVVMKDMGHSFEIIYVDDGSVDAGSEHVAQFMQEDHCVHLIRLSRHFGQTEAMQAGIDHAKGDILVFLDADGQNDPHSIPKLIEKIKEGYAVVSGWRKDRKDTFLTRILPSRIANMLISFLSGVKLHDYGCSLKAYRREVFQQVRLFSEMHRLIPIWARKYGYSITEVEVIHRGRHAGKSKYTLSRIPRVLLDLFVTEFMRNYLHRPMYVFGMWAVILFLLSSSLMVIISMRTIFFGGVWVSPLLFLSVICSVLSFQFLLMGLLAEIIIRLYYQTTKEKTYSIERDYIKNEA